MNSRVPDAAGDSYLVAGQQGGHSWQRYLAGTLAVAFMWLVGGSVLSILAAVLVLVARGDFSATTIVLLLTTPPPELIIPAFAVLMVSFIPFFLGVLGVVRFLHKRPVRTLVTGAPRVNWQRVAVGFGLWLLLSAGTTGIDLALRPGMYSFQFDPAVWIPFALLALLLIPIQAGTEELFFRGYLIQATRIVTRNPLLLILPSSLLFAALHLANPEISVNLPVVASFYLLFALFAAWISLREGTIELALGMHVANNLMAVVVTFPESAIPAPAPLVKLTLEPALDVTLFVVMAAIFALLTVRKKAPRGEVAHAEARSETAG